jgi:hypothetical protein
MQKLILYSLAFGALIFFSNCSIDKYLEISKLYKTPSSIIAQKERFRKEIPFKLEYGAIIIPVKIENETYEFLFEANSESSVSFDFASKLNLKDRKKIEINDADSSVYYFDNIPNINIGGIDFENNVIGLKNFDCNPYDSISGVIGTNLMRNAIWQIDYQKKRIILTNYKDSLCSKDTKNIDFNVNADGKPYFYTHFSPYNKIGTLISTCAYTNLDLPGVRRKYTMPSTAKYLKSYRTGICSTDTFRHVTAPYVRFDGEWILKDRPVTFRQDNRNFATMGYLFLKNYTVTFDWAEKKIGFQQVSEPVRKFEDTYGFFYGYRNGVVVCTDIVENSPASAVNLQLGEQILAIDGKDVSNISEEEYDKMVRSRNCEEENRKEQSITVKQKDGVKTHLLKKVDIDLWKW